MTNEQEEAIALLNSVEGAEEVYVVADETPGDSMVIVRDEDGYYYMIDDCGDVYVAKWLSVNDPEAPYRKGV